LRFDVAFFPSGEASHFVPFTPAATEVGVALLSQEFAQFSCERGVGSVQTMLHRLGTITPGVCVDSEPEATDGGDDGVGHTTTGDAGAGRSVSRFVARDQQ